MIEEALRIPFGHRNVATSSAMVWFESLGRKVNLAAEQSFSKCLSVLPGKKVLYVDPVFFDKRCEDRKCR